MKVEHPQAYQFILQDEVYYLNSDKIAKPVIDDDLMIQSSITEHTITTKTPERAFNYLGSNNKKFLILVNYSNAEHIDAVHLTALERVLLRKELNLSDVAIFNTRNYPGSSFQEISEYFTPMKLLILGSEALPEEMKILELNQTGQLHGLPVLFSYSFSEMMSNTDNKRTFWELMKKL